MEKYKDANGKQKSKKVVTFRGEEPLRFSNWMDSSPPPETLAYVEVLHITRLFTNKVITMSSKVRENYHAQRTKFINKHKNRDK